MNYSSFVLPAAVAGAGIMIFVSKKDLTSSFIDGCKRGMDTTVSILPSLILLVVGVKMLWASGGVEVLCSMLSGVCAFSGIPAAILPVSVMRIISGSGATAAVKNLFETNGPDSLAGLSASVLMGSSDTIIYTVSLYLSHAKVKKSGYTYPLALVVMLFCTVFACYVARVFY